MAELAKRVQQLGYTIARKADGSFELAGFTRRQVEAFSERAMDIERTKQARGISNPSIAAISCWKRASRSVTAIRWR
jgi:conjugative relaxase-like TrwC/TraI family protein